MAATIQVEQPTTADAARRGRTGAAAAARKPAKARAQRVRKVDTVPSRSPFVTGAAAAVEPRELVSFSFGPVLATRGALD